MNSAFETVSPTPHETSPVRCLVTGASGHLGSYVARRLVESGAQVTALVRPSSDLWRLSDILSQIHILRADLSALAPIQEQIVAAAPDITFHLGWFGITSEFRHDPRQITANVGGSLDLCQMVHEAGCGAWVGIGSQAEYGPQHGILTEAVLPHPNTTYGIAKYCTGLLTKELCALQQMRYVWLRVLAVYGPHDDERHLIPTVIKQLLAQQRPALTPGEQKWDYLYIDDAAAAIYAVGLNMAAEGVYNIGSGEAPTVQSIVKGIRDLIDPSLPLDFGKVPYGANQIMHLQADITRLQQATGWSPQVPLQEGLRRTIDWYWQRS